jgi:rubrerythrin
LNKDLRFHPFKIHITHELKKKDKASHENFYREFLELVDNDEGVLDCDHVRRGPLPLIWLCKQTEFEALEQ